MTFDDLLQENKNITNSYIIEKIKGSSAHEAIKEAMLYSIKAGGKGIRPNLFFLTLKALGCEIEDKHLAFGAALEMIHTYSLIHDDLPAMDNDDYRRGLPTSHKRFGEANAILAGDALLNLAFETLLEVCEDKKDIEAARVIGKASGFEGMISGQVMDMGELEAEEEILKMYSLKTGALFKASVLSAASLCGANMDYREKLSDFALYLGLAFQLKDDLIDKTSIIASTGKPKNSDEKNKKSTFISHKGIIENEILFDRYTKNALEIIEYFEKEGKDFSYLKQLTNLLAVREK